MESSESSYCSYRIAAMDFLKIALWFLKLPQISTVPSALRSKATGSPGVGRDNHWFVLGLNEAHQILRWRREQRFRLCQIHHNLSKSGVPVYIIYIYTYMYVYIYIYMYTYIYIYIYTPHIHVVSMHTNTCMHVSPETNNGPRHSPAWSAQQGVRRSHPPPATVPGGNVGVLPVMVVPHWYGWCVMENTIKLDDLGVPLFQETSIWIMLCISIKIAEISIRNGL